MICLSCLTVLCLFALFFILHYLFNYAHARTALRQGLFLLGAKESFTIAVPDFLCDVVLHPLRELNLNIIFYPLHDDLSPDWSEVSRINFQDPFSAIVMVHYFGFPQNIDKFISFCTSNNIFLIEDAAHCAGGKFEGRLLGTFGHIGIISSRKMLNQQYGAHLYVNSEHINIPLDFNSSLIPPPLSAKCLFKFLFARSRRLTSFFRLLSSTQYDWNDPTFFRESKKPHYSLPLCSKFYIKYTSWPSLIQVRRDNWNFWDNFFRKHDIYTPFPFLADGICPWVFPIYARDILHRNLILTWGIKNSIPMFTWPVLPNQFLFSSHPAFQRWERLVCIPLDFCYPITTPLQALP